MDTVHHLLANLYRGLIFFLPLTEYIMDGMQKQKNFHNKNRAEALKRYANYSKKLSKSLKEESVKIQTKLDKISK